jgi:hypothetical protein
LLGNGVQEQMFTYVWVAKLSLASATSFWQQLLTTTELNSPLTAVADWSWLQHLSMDHIEIVSSIIVL